MNMHGIIEPAPETHSDDRKSFVARAAQWMRVRRMLMLVVVLPTLLVTTYLYLIAADQYESEAHFLVRAVSPTPAPTIGVSQALSSITGINNGQDEAMSVADYLTSHDVVAELRAHSGLVQRFQDPKADFLSKLWGSDPTPEKLLSYYRSQVKVQFNTETGITTLRVHSFQPGDSYAIVTRLLQLGEQRVNELNRRSYGDAIAVAQKQLAQAENSLTANQMRMTRFRQSSSDIDPTASGTAQIGLVSTLTGQLATTRAQLAAMGSVISHSSPQYVALAGRERALSAQVAAQSSRLAGSGNTIANDIGGYEELKFRQAFLAKQYDAAAAALQSAREQAIRQQLYLVRVVNPNMPVKALYPKRARTVATVFIALMLLYSIGWLIAAGVREHAV
jgi:capsular polysaccharide transport system permease protein